jgi:hypothetical protein
VACRARTSRLGGFGAPVMAESFEVCGIFRTAQKLSAAEAPRRKPDDDREEPPEPPQESAATEQARDRHQNPVDAFGPQTPPHHVAAEYQCHEPESARSIESPQTVVKIQSRSLRVAPALTPVNVRTRCTAPQAFKV